MDFYQRQRINSSLSWRKRQHKISSPFNLPPKKWKKQLNSSSSSTFHFYWPLFLENYSQATLSLSLSVWSLAVCLSILAKFDFCRATN